MTGTAQSGLKAVQGEGEKAKTAELKRIGADQKNKLDIAPLAQAARDAVDNISAIPSRGDIVPLGAGHNVSVGHMNEGRTEDGRNKGNLGAEGAHGVPPLTTRADKDRVTTTGTITVPSGSQTITGATSQTQQAAANFASSITGGAQATGQAASNTAASTGAATSVVINQSGSSSSSLPNLDLKGGLDLSRSGGGGVEPMPMLTDQLKPKPYATGVGRESGDSPKKAMPKR